jgi:hypothetical protein
MTMLTTILALAVQVSTPALISTIDTGKLKGEPTQLAWSPDGTKLFLQTSERDSLGMTTKPRFYLLSAADGKAEPLSGPPAWVAEYWTWKAGQYAPGSKTFGIEHTDDIKTVTATAAPMGGALAKGSVSGDPGGGGTSAGDVVAHAGQTQRLRVIKLTLKGETVGEFVGVQFLPGYTYGWSPKSIGMIAYGNQAGRLTVMDEQGQKQLVESTRNVILPAWSSDGAKIAFLQKAGKNKYDLYVADVKP